MDMTTEQIIEAIKQQARAIGACDKLVGTEDLAALARLIMTPAGMEFCINNRFPAGPTWRQLKQVADLTQYGIYVDAGNIELTNPDNVLIVGRTTATITCNGKGRRNINVLRDASVIAIAYDWTVVRVKADPSCHIIKQQHGNAIII
jgi:hypothetical protein